MGMGFALTWLRQVSPPLLHMTTLTTGWLHWCKTVVTHHYAEGQKGEASCDCRLR